ncbi:phage baseplate plug family protein [Immundisolibacter sp.]
MAYVTLPVRTDLPAYDFSIILDGETFIFSFEWNERGSYWTMDVLDSEGNHLVAGVRMTTGVNLLAQYRNENLPKGSLFLLDTRGFNDDPQVDNFGKNVLLMYRELGTVDE